MIDEHPEGARVSKKHRQYYDGLVNDTIRRCARGAYRLIRQRRWEQLRAFLDYFEGQVVELESLGRIPVRMHDSIHVLGLNVRSEACLALQGLHTVEDLLFTDEAFIRERFDARTADSLIATFKATFAERGVKWPVSWE